MMTDNNSFQMAPEAQQPPAVAAAVPPPPPLPPQQQQHQQQQPQQAPSTAILTATTVAAASAVAPATAIQPAIHQQSTMVAQPVLMQQTQPPFPMPMQQSQQNNSLQHVIKEEDIKQETELNISDGFASGQQPQQQQQHQYHSDIKPTILVRPPSQQDNRTVVGRLSYQDDTLYITEGNTVDIGRNSSTSSVHFHVGQNNFISRKHFQILHDSNNGDFYIIVISKNGIFIDDQFTRKSHEPERLPRSCHFRFPSTDIRILFESFLEKDFDEIKMTKPIDQSNGVYSPLKIKIPKAEKKSPPPSPTGTLSAANSCPTSPRQSFRDYHNHNNNNGYQNDTHAPSSSQNEYEKPLYSYAQLIVQSISASPEKQLTLSGIYSFITKNYPYYRKEANKGWQNSIRHNLSLNRYFLKVERSQDEPGKGSFWRIDPNSEAKLIDQSYRKRRQRGSQCFRTPYGMPRSAPASPSHIDHSRDSSPLHDIVLQSAPGSPQQSTAHGNAQRNGNSNVPLPMWPE